jgi:hypothetical protein
MFNWMNTKKKGNRTELKVASFFKEWSGWEFTRVPMSGGLQWRNRASVSADIICAEEGIKWPYSVEVKGVKDINFEKLLYDAKSEVEKFWEQTTRDAKSSNKLPLLFMRYNGLPKGFFFVVMKYGDFKTSKSLSAIRPKMLVQSDTTGTLAIFPSTELFKTSFKEFYKHGKRLTK